MMGKVKDRKAPTESYSETYKRLFGNSKCSKDDKGAFKMFSMYKPTRVAYVARSDK